MNNYNLLNDFEIYTKKMKAERVYKKCLFFKKNFIAEKIKNKYSIKQKNDDLIMSIFYYLKSL